MLGFSPVGAEPIGAAGGAEAVSYALTGTTGAFDLTGETAKTSEGHRAPGASGAFDVTGEKATLSTEGVSAPAGEFNLEGEAAGFQTQRRTPGATGHISISGHSATLGGIRRPTTPVALMLAAAIEGNAPCIGYYTVPETAIFDLGYEGVISLGISMVATATATP